MVGAGAVSLETRNPDSNLFDPIGDAISQTFDRVGAFFQRAGDTLANVSDALDEAARDTGQRVYHWRETFFAAENRERFVAGFRTIAEAVHPRNIAIQIERKILFAGHTSTESGLRRLLTDQGIILGDGSIDFTKLEAFDLSTIDRKKYKFLNIRGLERMVNSGELDLTEFVQGFIANDFILSNGITMKLASSASKEAAFQGAKLGFMIGALPMILGESLYAVYSVYRSGKILTNEQQRKELIGFINQIFSDETEWTPEFTRKYWSALFAFGATAAFRVVLPPTASIAVDTFARRLNTEIRKDSALVNWMSNDKGFHKDVILNWHLGSGAFMMMNAGGEVGNVVVNSGIEVFQIAQNEGINGFNTRVAEAIETTQQNVEFLGNIFNGAIQLAANQFIIDQDNSIIFTGPIGDDGATANFRFEPIGDEGQGRLYVIVPSEEADEHEEVYLGEISQDTIEFTQFAENPVTGEHMQYALGVRYQDPNYPSPQNPDEQHLGTTTYEYNGPIFREAQAQAVSQDVQTSAIVGRNDMNYTPEDRNNPEDATMEFRGARPGFQQNVSDQANVTGLAASGESDESNMETVSETSLIPGTVETGDIRYVYSNRESDVRFMDANGTLLFNIPHGYPVEFLAHGWDGDTLTHVRVYDPDKPANYYDGYINETDLSNYGSPTIFAEDVEQVNNFFDDEYTVQPDGFVSARVVSDDSDGNDGSTNGQTIQPPTPQATNSQQMSIDEVVEYTGNYQTREWGVQIEEIPDGAGDSRILQQVEVPAASNNGLQLYADDTTIAGNEQAGIVTLGTDENGNPVSGRMIYAQDTDEDGNEIFTFMGVADTNGNFLVYNYSDSTGDNFDSPIGGFLLNDEGDEVAGVTFANGRIEAITNTDRDVVFRNNNPVYVPDDELIYPNGSGVIPGQQQPVTPEEGGGDTTEGDGNETDDDDTAEVDPGVAGTATGSTSVIPESENLVEKSIVGNQYFIDDSKSITGNNGETYRPAYNQAGSEIIGIEVTNSEGVARLERNTVTGSSDTPVDISAQDSVPDSIKFGNVRFVLDGDKQITQVVGNQYGELVFDNTGLFEEYNAQYIFINSDDEITRLYRLDNGSLKGTFNNISLEEFSNVSTVSFNSSNGLTTVSSSSGESLISEQQITINSESFTISELNATTLIYVGDIVLQISSDASTLGGPFSGLNTETVNLNTDGSFNALQAPANQALEGKYSDFNANSIRFDEDGSIIYARSPANTERLSGQMPVVVNAEQVNLDFDNLQVISFNISNELATTTSRDRVYIDVVRIDLSATRSGNITIGSTTIQVHEKPTLVIIEDPYSYEANSIERVVSLEDYLEFSGQGDVTEAETEDISNASSSDSLSLTPPSDATLTPNTTNTSEGDIAYYISETTVKSQDGGTTYQIAYEDESGDKISGILVEGEFRAATNGSAEVNSIGNESLQFGNTTIFVENGQIVRIAEGNNPDSLNLTFDASDPSYFDVFNAQRVSINTNGEVISLLAKDEDKLTGTLEDIDLEQTGARFAELSNDGIVLSSSPSVLEGEIGGFNLENSNVRLAVYYPDQDMISLNAGAGNVLRGDFEINGTDIEEYEVGFAQFRSYETPILIESAGKAEDFIKGPFADLGARAVSFHENGTISEIVAVNGGTVGEKYVVFNARAVGLDTNGNVEQLVSPDNQTLTGIVQTDNLNINLDEIPSTGFFYNMGQVKLTLSDARSEDIVIGEETIAQADISIVLIIGEGQPSDLAQNERFVTFQEYQEFLDTKNTEGGGVIGTEAEITPGADNTPEATTTDTETDTTTESAEEPESQADVPSGFSQPGDIFEEPELEYLDLSNSGDVFLQDTTYDIPYIGESNPIYEKQGDELVLVGFRGVYSSFIIKVSDTNDAHFEYFETSGNAVNYLISKFVVTRDDNGNITGISLIQHMEEILQNQPFDIYNVDTSLNNIELPRYEITTRDIGEQIPNSILSNLPNNPSFYSVPIVQTDYQIIVSPNQSSGVGYTILALRDNGGEIYWNENDPNPQEQNLSSITELQFRSQDGHGIIAILSGSTYAVNSLGETGFSIKLSEKIHIDELTNVSIPTRIQPAA